MPLRLGVLLAVGALALAGPAHAQTPTPTPTRTPTPTPTPTPSPTPTPDPVIGAAGDIACDPSDPGFNDGLGTVGHCREKATSDLLLAAHPVAVLPLGDTQYEEGILDTYARSYGPTWGRLKDISHPAVGNHEYFGGAGDGAGYFDYFNGVGVQSGPAGTRGQDYYSYDVGGWHLVALDSVCSQVGGCGPGSPQETWLRADLAAHPAACTLAYWHHPRWTSTGVGWTSMGTLYQDLYDAGAEVVLSGHIHQYERFAPLNPAGGLDPAYGVREFVVGTGGKNLQSLHTPGPASEASANSSFGVLLMTLHPDGYDFRFAPTEAGGFRDAGSGTCHGPPPGRPPAAGSGAATTTGKTAARLTAAVDTGNAPTTFHFEYGLTPGYGAATPEQPAAGFADGVRQVSARITRLKKGRTYHYRVVATNAAGAAPGADRTFVAGVRTPYPQAIARTPGLLAYWRLNDAGFAFDEQGGNLAVGSGPIPLTAGALIGDRSPASAFDGHTSALEASGPVVSRSATIEGWFRWVAGANILRDDSSARGWLIGRSGTRLGYRVSGRVYRTGRDIATVRDGAWHYIAVTKSGSSVAIWVDGRRVHSGSGAGDTPPTMPWHIMRNGPFEDHTQGNADEVAIYNRSLPAATLLAHYRAGVADRAPVTRISGPAGPTNDAAPSFALGANVKRSTARCSLAGPRLKPVIGPCGTAASFGPLADGSYTLTAYAIDPTGHPDPSPLRRAFRVDTVAPQLGLSAPARVPAALRRRGLLVRAACSESCTVLARLSVTAGEASRLHLSKRGRAVIGSAGLRISGAHTRALRVRLTRRVQKRLRGKRPPAVTLHVVATDLAGNKRAERRELLAR